MVNSDLKPIDISNRPDRILERRLEPALADASAAIMAKASAGANGSAAKAPPDPPPAPLIIEPTPFVWQDPRTIPSRDWLYAHHLLRGCVSATFAPGGLGKSSLALVEAVAMATGRDLLGVGGVRKLRVWYWNGEDPGVETKRRITAILKHYEIDPAELGGRLFTDTGREMPIIVAKEQRSGIVIHEPVRDALIAALTKHKIDVLIVDPFVAAHEVTENDNSKIAAVMRVFSHIADVAAAAVGVVHHVRKGQSGQGELTVDDGRGAGAMKDGARDVRVANYMTADEAAKAGIDSPKAYFRIDSGKSNYSKQPEKSTWRRFVSVDLENPTDGRPGDSVGVVEAWEWPDAFDGVTVANLQAVQDKVAAGTWRENHQTRNWVGKAVAEVLGLNPTNKADKAKIKSLITTWLKTGMLIIVTGKDDNRIDRPFVEVGERA